MRNVPAVAAALAGLSDDDVLAAIDKLKGGEAAEPPVKLVALDARLAQPEGYEDDVPINPDFHARRLPAEIWRSPPLTDSLASVIQLHRLREVLALIGFTRFEAEVPDINGEFDTDVAIRNASSASTSLASVAIPRSIRFAANPAAHKKASAVDRRPPSSAFAADPCAAIQALYRLTSGASAASAAAPSASAPSMSMRSSTSSISDGTVCSTSAEGIHRVRSNRHFPSSSRPTAP
jgi:hypothetical protein